MRKIIILFMLILSFNAIAQSKTIHVFVALCDNANQGIVPVPSHLGNGQDAKNNLYWGAMFGLKSFFRYKSNNWKYVKSLDQVSPFILERVLFKHKTEDIFLVADAYDGAFIKKCTEDFLLSSNGLNKIDLAFNEKALGIGGNANLVAYIGHDGLMEFDVTLNYSNNTKVEKDVIILACSSQAFFSEEIKKSKANPLLWTTNLMAPEAYTLEAALEGWIRNEDGNNIKERASQAYNKYQKCGINGARRLFATGFKKK